MTELRCLLPSAEAPGPDPPHRPPPPRLHPLLTHHVGLQRPRRPPYPARGLRGHRSHQRRMGSTPQRLQQNSHTGSPITSASTKPPRIVDGRTQKLNAGVPGSVSNSMGIFYRIRHSCFLNVSPLHVVMPKISLTEPLLPYVFKNFS